MNQNEYIKQFEKIIEKADQLKVLIANNEYSRKTLNECELKSNQVVDILSKLEINLVQIEENKENQNSQTVFNDFTKCIS
jgi:hypothetical protein